MGWSIETVRPEMNKIFKEETEEVQKELQQMQSQLMGVEQARQQLVNNIIKKSGELELLQRLGQDK